MPKVLIPVLRNAIEPQFLKRVRLFPVDERLVPLNDPENNTGVYLSGLANTFFTEQFAVIEEIENSKSNEEIY